MKLQIDQDSSESSIWDILEKLPFIGRALALIKSIRAFSRDNFGKIHSGTSLPHWIYVIALCSGIAATFVSAMIEYWVMIDIYDTGGGILSFIGERLKLAWQTIRGGEAVDLTNTEQNISFKTFAFPFLTVVAFEGGKCILVLFRHSVQEHIGFWRYFFSLSGLLRSFLIFISCFCSIVFFSQLLNKPNEDEIDSKIEEARTKILDEDTIKKKINDEVDIDKLLKDWRNEKKKLQQENEVNRENWRTEIDLGRHGREASDGPVAKGLKKIVDDIDEKIEKLDIKIAEREENLREEATNQVNTDAENDLARKTESIRKGGKALDPKWMSASLSALYEGFYPGSEGKYTRSWAVIFLGLFSLLISMTLELTINEMFRRFAKTLSATDNSNVPA